VVRNIPGHQDQVGTLAADGFQQYLLARTVCCTVKVCDQGGPQWPGDFMGMFCITADRQSAVKWIRYSGSFFHIKPRMLNSKKAGRMHIQQSMNRLGGI